MSARSTSLELAIARIRAAVFGPLDRANTSSGGLRYRYIDFKR